MTANLAPIIDAAWENRADLSTSTTGEVRDAVTQTLALLDAGKARVAEPDGNGGWTVNQWLKKAVLLSFRLNENKLMSGWILYCAKCCFDAVFCEHWCLCGGGHNG